ncbi:flagellar assembly protein FliH [Pontibacillus sp. HMF3514]|uniref:flagellar assembly protein FliH n=1 Tax=Pontibacillus sp. HMF3514 TaxID=2692425 RepID=UPI00131FB7DF|nr:flagellar assembly protein FliH [Pontibacillus sp. HMF3514]QHE52190.1 flagellar assembly protein FliH [Pontibacillus sp. HMF3514]
MSNHQSPSGKRVIGIKPFFQQQAAEPVTNEVEEKSVNQEHKAHQMQQEADEKLKHAESKLAEANEQADQALKQAQEKIQLEKEQWEKEKQQLVEETTKTAYDEGHEQGKNDAFREYEQLIEEARRIVETAHEDYHHKVEKSEETILNLGLKVAEKILGKKLEDDPSSFLSIVHSVIQEVKELEQLALYVHPDQYSIVINQKNELELIVDHHADLSIYPKNGLQPYQCYIETSFGRVDASIDSQLEEIRTKLFNLLREA